MPLDRELVDFVSHGRLQYTDLDIMWSTNQNHLTGMAPISELLSGNMLKFFNAQLLQL
jgi:hypothetical protein